MLLYSIGQKVQREKEKNVIVHVNIQWFCAIGHTVYKIQVNYRLSFERMKRIKINKLN